MTYPITVFKYLGQPYLTPVGLLVTILPDKRCVVLIVKVIYEYGGVMYSARA